MTEAQLVASPAVRIARKAVNYYLRGFHRVRLLAPCPLPPSGPAILVSNHISGLDPIVIQDACPQRLIQWMMAREYYQVPVLKKLYESAHCIPVERSGRDLAATRLALRTLAESKVLGIFPEGRIGLSGQVLPFQTGVALLALRTGAPIYPAYLEGSVRNTEMVEAFMQPHDVALAFGPPVALQAGQTSRQAMEEATLMIHAAVSNLRDRFFPSYVHG
jgi:1-acyl-sn-glycerol-3-phosphate acyltransferase